MDHLVGGVSVWRKAASKGIREGYGRLVWDTGMASTEGAEETLWSSIYAWLLWYTLITAEG